MFPCAGSMALHIVVLSPQKSGRIDINLINRIMDIVSDGRPTLICVNQMARYLNWWKTAEEANAACQCIHKGIVDKAKQERSSCGPVTISSQTLPQKTYSYLE